MATASSSSGARTTTGDIFTTTNYPGHPWAGGTINGIPRRFEQDHRPHQPGMARRRHL
jgi:hypothetical protein